jgi:hypothetical protein
MKLQILAGALMVLVLVASCAAQPEEVAPTTVPEDTVAAVDEPAELAGEEVDAVSSDAGEQDTTEASAPVPESTPAVPVDSTEPRHEDSAGPPDEGLEASEPTVPEVSPSELPEPGGPWTDSREPDITKTVPPPRR